MASARVGAVGCTPLSNPLQSFQGFWDQNASLRLQTFHLIFSAQLCLPKTKDGHSSLWGGIRDKGHLWAGGYMMGELSGKLSAQAALTPHLYQLWEFPQDGFFKI